jgi:hypothetical protein
MFASPYRDMAMHEGGTWEEQRPPFMVTLGLLPPYTLQDIHAAYREKSKTVHPDRGGTAAEFQTLREAYERAQDYLKHRLDRRSWLASRVERYVEQNVVADEVRRRGGAVDMQQIDWIKQSFGDFALLTEMLRTIRLRNLSDGDSFLSYLAEHAPTLEYLLWLDVSGSTISDEAVWKLQTIPTLRGLDLSGTPISEKALAVVKGLPNLESLHIADTSISWWARWRLRRSFPRLKVVTKARDKESNQDGRKF